MTTRTNNRSSLDMVTDGIKTMMQGDKQKGKGVQIAAHGLLLMIEGSDFPEKLAWGSLYQDQKGFTEASKVVINTILGERPKFDAKNATSKSMTERQSRISREAALKRAMKLTSILHARGVKPSQYDDKAKHFSIHPDLLLSKGEKLPFTPKGGVVQLDGSSVLVAREKDGVQSLGSVRCSVESLFKTHAPERGAKDGTGKGNAKDVSVAMAAQIVAKNITGKVSTDFDDDETTLKALRDCLVQLIGVFGEDKVQNIYKEAANG